MTVKAVKLFFQQLQYAASQKKLYFSYKGSQDLESILNILQHAHFIAGYTKTENTFQIFLCYDMLGNCVINEIQTVSSIRQRVVINIKQIRVFLNDYPYSLAIIRTKDGIMNIKTCWEKKIGGEVIAYIK